MAEFDDEVENEAREEPEAPRPSKLFQHYLAVYNDPADYMRTDPHRKHRDEFNDITNWIPSEQNQPYDTGRQDEYGNPIMGSRYNDALMSRFDDTPVNSNKSVVDLAAGWVQSTKQEGGDPLQQLSKVNVGAAVSGFASRLISDKFKESKLYADYFYGADEKRQAIAHATELFSQGLINVDPASLGNVSTEQQRKIWANMMEQVKFVEKLQNLKDIPGTTDENGRVDMRKVLAQFPEIRDVLNEKGTNAAVLALMEAKHIKKIDEVYSNEFTRFFGAVGTGLQRGFNNLGKQVVGAKAALSAMLGNRPKNAFTKGEKEYLDMLNRLNEELPENSYTGVGSAIGGILGSALENAPLVLTAILGAQAGGAAAVAAGASAPVAAAVGAAASVGLMGLEIGGSQYEQNVNKRDKEGRRMYTPEQAAYLSMTQGLAEGVLEQYTLKQMGNAIMGRPALKELTALYSSEAARDLALVAGKGVGEAELKAQTTALVEQTLKDMANAGVVSFKTELFEEFTQQVSDMVIENAYQLALKGEKAELSSMQDILVESIGAAAEAVPAVIGFGAFGMAGHGAMHRRQLFSPRQYINDLHTEMAQTILNNQHLIETIESVGNNLDSLSELQGKAPEVVQQILDSNNERNGIKTSVIDIKALKQEEGGQAILDEIAKRANISEDELAACEAGTGLLTVDTSFLMQVSSTAEDAGKKALFRNVTKEGILKTNAMAEAEIEEMKKVAAILSGKADIDQEAAIEKYAKGMLKDNEQVQRAMDILRADIEHPHAELKKRLKDIQAEIDAELGSTITGLKAGMKQGVDIVQTDEGGVRVSNNAPWYQNFFADNGRAPTQAELEQIAYENATGQATRYADMDMSYDGSPEEQQYFTETKAKLDALFKEREALQELEPNLRWVQPGDVIAASTLTAEGVNVYRQVKETLLQGNKEVAASAAASALLFARQAERAAQMHQEAGETNYTAEDYLMGIVANAQTADQSLAQMQSQMEAVRQQYEGTAQWMKAPNGQDTKLTERQWLQVRTPAFKAWFGDWERAYKNVTPTVFDENLSLLDEDGAQINIKDTKAVSKWVRRNFQGSTVTIDSDNNVVGFSRKGIDDGVSKARDRGVTDKNNRLLYSKLKEIIQNSHFVEDETVDERHKGRSLGIKKYVSLMFVGEQGYRVDISLNVQVDESLVYKGHQAYKIEIRPYQHLDQAEQTAGLTDNDRISKYILADILPEVNNNVSKVVDENGEPKVVYHGSPHGNIEVFKEESYFTGDKAYADQYQRPTGSNWRGDQSSINPKTYEVFLNIRNPFDTNNNEEAREIFESEFFGKWGNGTPLQEETGLPDWTDATDLLEFIEENEYDFDGIMLDEQNGGAAQDHSVSFVPVKPNQIKSAVDNNGNFSLTDDNIYYQILGEKGAAELDRQEEVTTRLDNLAAARQMEDAGKDAKTIKLATGWERGADGKWRYEIPDGKVFREYKLKLSTLNKKLKENQRKIDSLNKEIYDIAKNQDENSSDYIAASQKLQAAYNEKAVIEGAIALNTAIEAAQKGETFIASTDIASLLNDDTLIDAYPSLSRIKVKFESDATTRYVGYTTLENGKMVIGINVAKAKDINDIIVTLHHEIQHAIQDKEGFAEGGNLISVKDIALQKKEEVSKELDALREERFSAQSTIRDKIHKLEASVKDKIDAMREASMKGEMSRQEFLRRSKDVYSAIPGYTELRQEAEKYDTPSERENKLAAILESYKTDFTGGAFRTYQALAGEVEARNVQTRMDMPWADRQKTLLAETEDVAREDQIFLRGENVGGQAFSAANEFSHLSLPKKKKRRDKRSNRPVMTSDGNLSFGFIPEARASNGVIMPAGNIILPIGFQNGGEESSWGHGLTHIQKHADTLKKQFNSTEAAIKNISKKHDYIIYQKPKTSDELPSYVLYKKTGKTMGVALILEYNETYTNGEGPGYYSVLTIVPVRANQIKKSEALSFDGRAANENSYKNPSRSPGAATIAKSADGKPGPADNLFPTKEMASDAISMTEAENLVKKNAVADKLGRRLRIKELFQQGAAIKGAYSQAQNIIALFQAADQSTFMHESAHAYLEDLRKLAEQYPDSTAAKEYATIMAWAAWKDGDAAAYAGTAAAGEFAKREAEIKEALKNGYVEREINGQKVRLTANEVKAEWAQERFARAFEEYLKSGKAPASSLAQAFRKFKNWLTRIYKDVTGAGVRASAEVEAIMARMVASDEEIENYALVKRAERIQDIDADLLDTDTQAMLQRWEDEAKERAKEKLLAQLIKEYEKADVKQHMDDYRKQLEDMAKDMDIFKAEAVAKATGEQSVVDMGFYDTIEDYHDDLAMHEGGYDAFIEAELKEEEERFKKQMPNAADFKQRAEDAYNSGAYATRIAALEAEILGRRIEKYANAPRKLAEAMDDVEQALAQEDKPLEKAILALKYAFRWETKQAEKIALLQDLVQELKAAAKEDKQSIKDKMSSEVKALKAETMQNKAWLRGVRDAANGKARAHREAARQKLARLPIREAGNTRAWLREADKAGRECMKALTAAVSAKDDATKQAKYKEAQDAKLRQAAYNAMAAESIKLKRSAERMVNAIKRRAKAAPKNKHLDAQNKYYLGHVLYMFKLKAQDNLKPVGLLPLPDLLKNLATMGFDCNVDPAVINEAGGVQPGRKHTDLNIMELQEVRDLVDFLYVSGVNLGKLLTTDEYLPDVVMKLMQAHDDATALEQERKAREKNGINDYMLQLLKPEVMLKLLDSKQGLFVKYIYQPLFEGQEQKRVLSEKSAEQLKAILDAWLPMAERNKLTEVVETLFDEQELTKENIVAMALNWGNAQNKQRLLAGLNYGKNPNEQFIQEADVLAVFEKHLSANDWNFVQQIWDYVGQYGDDVNKVVQDCTGNPMERVQAEAFNIKTSDGQTLGMPGGYYPIKRDPAKSSVQQELEVQNQASGGQVLGMSMGSTKSRAKGPVNMGPLMLELNVISRHVDQQIHIITMRKACLDSYRLLRQTQVADMITQQFGEKAHRIMLKWVEDVWHEPMGESDLLSGWGERIRANTVKAIMAYRVSTAMLNFANIAPMADRLGVANTVKALAQFMAHPRQMREFVMNDSAFMRSRAENMDRDLRTQQSKMLGSNKYMEAIDKYANFLIAETDLLCGVPTYNWAYQESYSKAIAEGKSAADAAKQAHFDAHEAVRSVLGSADSIDQAAIQRNKSLFIKALTPFYSFFNAQMNAVWAKYYQGRYEGQTIVETDAAGNVTRTPVKEAFMQRYKGFAYSWLMRFVIMAGIETAIRAGLAAVSTGHDDKPEKGDLWERFIKQWAINSVDSASGGFPVLNGAVSAIFYGLMGESKMASRGVADAGVERLVKPFEMLAKEVGKGKGIDPLEFARLLTKGVGGSWYGVPDTLTDATFNTVRFMTDDYKLMNPNDLREYIGRSLLDKKLKAK